MDRAAILKTNIIDNYGAGLALAKLAIFLKVCEPELSSQDSVSQVQQQAQPA